MANDCDYDDMSYFGFDDDRRRLVRLRMEAYAPYLELTEQVIVGYGAFGSALGDCIRHQVAMPFRGESLLSFGAEPGAELLSLRVGLIEYVTTPVPLDREYRAAMPAEWFFQHVVAAGAGRDLSELRLVHGVELRLDLARAPKFPVKTASPGEPIEWRTRGKLQGLLLIGRSFRERQSPYRPRHPLEGAGGSR